MIMNANRTQGWHRSTHHSHFSSLRCLIAHESYNEILIARLLLGFAEAPFSPGTMYLISGWYKRDELAMRATIINCGSVLSSGLGTLFSSGILAGMQGVLGQASWRRETFVSVIR
jgi:MFS family permease